MSTPPLSIPAWKRRHRGVLVRAISLLVAMLAAASGVFGPAESSALAVVILGALFAWVAGVELLSLQMALVQAARRHRIPADGQRERLWVLGALAFACEAASIVGITTQIAHGRVHPQIAVLVLEFATLCVLWSQIMVARRTHRLAGALELASDDRPV